MIDRTALPRIREALSAFPVVAIVGPRQAGKTTLALAVAETLGPNAQYLDLELPSDRAKLDDPELYLSSGPGVLKILDEIQRVPEIFQVMRGLVDRARREGRRNGQFLVLGSASPRLLKQTSESLAGRIAYLELAPFSETEVRDLDARAVDRLWLRGGFPDSFLADSDASSLAWRTAFIRTYLERDIPELGPRIPSETLFRFWQMLAHNQGQMLNAARLAGSLDVSGQTISRYLSIMTGLFLVRRLLPWAGNSQKRLVRAPKTYVRDSGLAHALLGIRTYDDLLGHPVVGASWEGMMIENIAQAVGDAAQLWFYRSANGAEIDLIVEFVNGDRWAVEIKRSLAPKASRGFYVGCDDVGAARRFMLYPGAASYRIGSEIEVVSLESLVRFLTPRLP